MGTLLIDEQAILLHQEAIPGQEDEQAGPTGGKLRRKSKKSKKSR